MAAHPPTAQGPDGCKGGLSVTGTRCTQCQETWSLEKKVVRQHTSHSTRFSYNDRDEFDLVLIHRLPSGWWSHDRLCRCDATQMITAQQVYPPERY